jgi:hypothetical protein
MWILPKQLHTSAFVADTKALDLDSEEFSQICEKSLTWRGKDSVSRTWLQRWKRENWMQHLCSRTLKPSHTESFEERYLSSLEDSRVSHSQLLESVKLLKTPDISSPTSQTESESANLELFSLKTYKGSSPARQQTESQFSNMSSESWKEWVTEQRQEYSQRKKSAHLTRESESSSWATPIASQAEKPQGPNSQQKGLQSQVRKDAVETHEKQKNWATPNICGNHNRKGASKTSGDGLSTQVKNWATPQTFDHVNIIRTPEKLAQTRAEKNAGCMNLREQVHYPDMDHSRTAAQNWPTPTTAEGTKIGNQANFGQVGLSNHPSIVGHPDQANPNTNGKNRESWPTPRETMSRDATYDRGKGNLGEVAQGKLNPDWVEHLMGLPVGWTQLPTAWIDSGCSATAL